MELTVSPDTPVRIVLWNKEHWNILEYHPYIEGHYYLNWKLLVVDEAAEEYHDPYKTIKNRLNPTSITIG